MSYGTAILLGLIQGATEFLPISSSGHLVLFRLITGEPTEGHLLFDVLLHVGTLVAVLAVYGRDVLHLVLSGLSGLAGLVRGQSPRALWARDPDLRLAVCVVVASLPAGVVGLLLGAAIERVGDHSLAVAGLLVLNGWVLFLAARVRVRERDLTVRGAGFVGLAQAFALLPGLSRSGLTISAGLAAGRPPDRAARLSFLLSVPAILGAAVLHLVQAGGGAAEEALRVPLPAALLAMLVSAVIGYAALRLLLRVLRHRHFGRFAFYCWLVGLAVLIGERML